MNTQLQFRSPDPGRLIKIFAALLFFLWLFGLCACSPEKRLARIVKKHPELVKSDTIEKIIEISIPEIEIDTSKEINPIYIKSLLETIEKYSKGIDSPKGVELKREVINIVNNVSLIKDTMSFTEDGVLVKLWQHNGRVNLKIFKPEEKKEVKVPVTVNTIQPAIESKKFNWVAFIAGLCSGIALSYFIIKLFIYLFKPKSNN